MNPIKPIIKVNTNEELDTTEKGESTKVQEEFTTSVELPEDKYSTFTDTSKQTEELIPTETSQVLTVFNKAIHHEDDSNL